MKEGSTVNVHLYTANTHITATKSVSLTSHSTYNRSLQRQVSLSQTTDCNGTDSQTHYNQEIAVITANVRLLMTVTTVVHNTPAYIQQF